MDSDGDSMHWANYVGEVSERFDVCRAFDRAPHVSFARTSTFPMLDDRTQVKLLFFRRSDCMTCHDRFPQALPFGTRSVREAPGDVGRPCGAWVRVFGQPKCIRADDRRGWDNAAWAHICSDRWITLQFQGVGAHTRILERRNATTRGIYATLVAAGRFPGEQILPGAQRRLNTLISAGGNSAYQLVFGSDQADLLGWGEKDKDLLFVQDASLSGRAAQQYSSRMTAREAALEEVANSRWRRPST